MKIAGGMLQRAVVGVASVLGVLCSAGTAAGRPTLDVRVDCAAGQTIAHALGVGNERHALRVTVMGQCNENVSIARDDVTLEGDSVIGGVVSGPDSSSDTIRITGSRVTVRALTVTGGRNGLLGAGARGMTVQECVVRSTGRSGVVFFQGASGTVDRCTIQHNPRDGIVIESASATVTNGTIAQNARVGIVVADGGSGRIGVNDLNAAEGNLITDNGSTGLHITIGSTAFVGGNTISGNGTNRAAPLGRFGIGVFNSSADIIGSNIIAGNANHGIFARSATLLIGDPGFDFSSVNTITGNGTALPGAGIFAFVGTSAVIRNAAVSGNFGFGVVLSLRSSAQMAGNTIQNNTAGVSASGDGIRLALGAGLFIEAPPAAANTVTGNSGFGVNCTDGETSVVNTTLLVLAPPSNGMGGVSPACTGF